MKTAGACLIALALCGTPLSGDDRDIARSYYLNAVTLQRRGNAAEAEALLRRAVAFQPDYSETWFLLGRILAARQETTAEGLSAVERSVTLASWTDTSPLEAKAALAALLLRTKRFREALALYDELRSRNVFSGEHELNRALAAYGSGDVKRADLLFSQALTEFPGDARIYRAYIKNLIRRRLMDRARLWTERALRQFPEDPVFLFYLTAVGRSAAEKKAAFERYRLMGGADPAVVLYFLNADEAVFADALDFFINHKGGDSVLLIESLMAGLRLNAARREAAARRLGVFEGEKTVDEDDDGFSEERYVFRANELTRIIIDRNQDGTAEAEIVMADNLPLEISISRPEGVRRFIYNGYPRLAKAVYQNAGETVTYDLIPDALRFAPLPSRPEPRAFRIRVAWPLSPALPSRDSLERASFSRTENPVDERRPLRKWDLFAGRPTVLREDSLRRGKFDRLVVYDESGRPLQGLIDLDGDGLFEVQETYVGGTLARISYDEDGDGRPEFFQDASGSTLEWDLDGDGRPDVIGRRGADGRIVADYSGLRRRMK